MDHIVLQGDGSLSSKKSIAETSKFVKGLLAGVLASMEQAGCSTQSFVCRWIFRHVHCTAMQPADPQCSQMGIRAALAEPYRPGHRDWRPDSAADGRL